MLKDWLSKTSGWQFYKWLFGPKKFSGLSRNETQVRVGIRRQKSTTSGSLKEINCGFLGKQPDVPAKAKTIGKRCLCKRLYIFSSVEYRVELMENNLMMLNTVLNRFTNSNVVLRKRLKTDALEHWEPIVNRVVQKVKESDDRFSKMQILRTGSYYERTKVDAPDEFDLMLVVENLELDDDPYSDDEDDGMSEPPKGWYI